MAVAPRIAADVLAEISFHLLEPIANCSITSVVSGGYGDGSFGGPPDFGGSYGYVLGLSDMTGIYVGAQVIVGWQLPDAEVATVNVVDLAAGTISINNLQSVHAVGEAVFAPTFSTQAPTDPLWTQTEMLEYLARAQNEFLLRCACLMQRFEDQLLAAGQQNQQTPATAIELERVAVQTGMVSLIVATVQRAGGVVTATLMAPTDFTAGMQVWIDGMLDNSFNSASTQRSDLATLTSGAETDPTGMTLIWQQAGANAASSGGTVNQLLYPRLYETTQEQVGLRNYDWFYDQQSPVPIDWYEDRTGKYQWGVAPVPRAGYLADLLASVRGPATLGLLDALVVPPIMAHIVKYGAMATALSKDGEARSPSYASYCRQRFEAGIAAVQRYMDSFVDAAGGS